MLTSSGEASLVFCLFSSSLSFTTSTLKFSYLSITSGILCNSIRLSFLQFLDSTFELGILSFSLPPFSKNLLFINVNTCEKYKV